ncbi:myb-like protein P [Clytia hemisphaerica]|uniref:myb-like protein P n=1 Tax=Clytia hemisphaerica TaxID=252671 RepID=UPI0034D3C5AC
MMMPSMFDSQSSQEFYSQSHMKLNSSRDVPPHPSSGSFANDGWSDTSSPQDHQDSWRSSTYSSKPLLFQSREQQQKQMKFHHQQHQKSSMNYQSSYFQDIMQKKNAEYNQRCFIDGVEKCLYQQSVQMKETLGLVKTDVIAELKSNLESSFSNMNSENKEKALESILTSVNQIKDDLQNIETLKSSIAKKDTELQVKSETINGLQGTIDELRSTIKSLGERERNSTQTSSQLLEKILQSNTTLASKLEKSLQAGNENQKQTQILIQNTKHLTDQNNLLLEKENMILDTVRKPNVFPDRHRNLYPGADHSFKSPRILQPRFTAQIRPSPTAVVAPIRREQCVPLDISLTNEIDVKMETSSPRKQGSFCSKKDRTTDMFDISSDSEGEDMGNIVNNFLISSNTSNENEQLVPCISTQQKQTYQQPQQPKQPKTQKPKICKTSKTIRPNSSITDHNSFNNLHAK